MGIKVREALGWKPEYTFESMVDEMVEYWMEHITEELPKTVS